MGTKTVKFELEFTVDEKFEVPEGKAVLRSPKRGDTFLPKTATNIDEAAFNFGCTELRIVFENPLANYRWPEFIQAGWWIAMDYNGVWYGYEREPVKALFQDGIWAPQGGINIRLGSTRLDTLIWTPPQVTDWQKSKFQKPKG